MPRDYSGDPISVAFFEPELGGHRWEYIRHIVSALARASNGVVATFVLHPELATKTLEFTRTCGSGSQKIDVVPIRQHELTSLGWGPLWLRAIRRWEVMSRYLGQLAVCHWHYLYLDHMQLPLALGFKVPPGVTVSGLLFRPSSHYGLLGGTRAGIREQIRDLRKRWAYDRMLRHRALAAVFTLDPLFPNFAAAHFRAGWKVRAIPDPAPVDQLSARVLRGWERVANIPAGRVCFLLFGALSERKGALQTLDAIARLEPGVAYRIAVVFAGHVDRGIREPFYERLRAISATRPEVWIDVRDRFIEDDELAALVARSDVVLAPYQRFVGSSGVLIWAATARRPVITQDYGLVGALTRQYGLGCVVDTRNPEEIAEAIAKAAEDPQLLLKNETLQAFLAGRTPEAFAESILRGIAELRHRAGDVRNCTRSSSSL